MMERDEMIKEASLFIAKEADAGGEEIDAGKALKELGLDSFRIIELVLFLERRTGRSFPEHAYTPANLKSVNSIVECFLKLEQ